jgi:hypothetical protein
MTNGTMKAARIEQQGDARGLVVGGYPLPQHGPGDVLVHPANPASPLTIIGLGNLSTISTTPAIQCSAATRSASPVRSR